jgi:hypothetical protein
MSVHASNMLYLFVLILQSCCLCCYLFIFNCSVSLYAYYIHMIHMFYVIIIMLIYGTKIIWKMPIFLTLGASRNNLFYRRVTENH